MRLSRLVLLLLLLVPAAAPAEEREPELLDRRTFNDDTWVSYRFYAPARAIIGFGGMESWDGGSFKASITWVMDPQGKTDRILAGRGWRTTSGRVLVHHEESGARVDQSLGTGGVSPGGSLVYHYPASEGIHQMVTVAGADGTWTGTRDFLGTEGVQLLAVTSGPGHLVTEEDFDGMALNVSAAGYRVRRGPGARVSRNFASGMFGVFAGADGARLAYEGPDSAAADGRNYEFFGGSAGDWTFTIQSSPPTDSTGRFDPGRTFLLVGDVVLA